MKAAPSAPATVAEFLDHVTRSEVASSPAANRRARAKLVRFIVVHATAYGLIKRCVTLAKLEAQHGASPLSRRLARRLAKVLEAESDQLLNTVVA